MGSFRFVALAALTLGASLVGPSVDAECSPAADNPGVIDQQPSPAPPAHPRTPGAEQPAPTAQPRTPMPEAAPMPPVARPRSRGQLVNVRVEVAISDQRGSAAPVTKNVTLVVADGDSGRVRSQNHVAMKQEGIPLPQYVTVPLNVDARPEILEGGRIRVALTLEYDLLDPGDQPSRAKAEIRESLTVILENGKPLMISQSADPLGDRRVTVDLKATIVK
jgi:hypothetical protein